MTLVWLLSRERDRAGNEMHYTYDVTAEEKEPYAIEVHPSAIEYTLQSNTGADARRSVTFAYEARPDPSFAYLSGVKLQTTQRLRAVEMRAPNPTATELVWQYTLAYADSPTHRSVLASVKKCGALGGCLLAREFRAGSSGGPWFYRSFEAAEAAPSGATLVADLDGDGKDDLLFERDGKRYLRKTPPGGSAVLTADALSTVIEVSGGAERASVFNEWKPADPTIAERVRFKVVGDFRGADKDDVKFEKALGLLLRALRKPPSVPKPEP